jgi:hypothetical protein
VLHGGERSASSFGRFTPGGKSSRYSLTGRIDEEKHSVLARTQAPVPELTLLTL